MGRLVGKVAVVTGGAKGIGRAVCLLFAREGAKVAVTDLDSDGAAEVARDIASSGGEASAFALNVADEAAVERVMKEAAEAFGAVHVLVNNAGISGARGPAHELKGEDWDRVHDVNVKGVFNCTKYAVPWMKKSGGGSIVNVASVLGVVANADNSPYVASKAAVRLMTKSDALSYAKEGIRVNSVSPAFVTTPLIENMLNSAPDPEKARKDLAGLHPQGRLGTPDEVAYAILYLASDEAGFTTGTDLVIDGGYTAR